MKSLQYNNHHKIILRDDERQPCEVWTRVMGYHRPVSQFNLGKKSEHRGRKHFLESQVQLPSARWQPVS